MLLPRPLGDHNKNETGSEMADGERSADQT